MKTKVTARKRVSGKGKGASMRVPSKGTKLTDKDREEVEERSKTPASETEQAEPAAAAVSDAEEEEEEVEYSEFVSQQTTKGKKRTASTETKSSQKLKWEREQEEQMTTFLKNRPALYMSGCKEYLSKPRREERLEVWRELEADMVGDNCTAENFETWYWTTRTLLGKAINDPPPPIIPGSKMLRKQWVLKEWDFHKKYLYAKSGSALEKEEPSRRHPGFTMSAKEMEKRALEAEDVPVDLATSDEDEEHTSVSTPKKMRRVPPRSTETPSKHPKSLEMATLVASQVETHLMDPEKRARKMIHDGHFMDLVDKLPPEVWGNFAMEYEQLCNKYRIVYESILQAEEDGRPFNRLEKISLCGLIHKQHPTYHHPVTRAQFDQAMSAQPMQGPLLQQVQQQAPQFFTVPAAQQQPQQQSQPSTSSGVLPFRQSF